MKFSVFTPTYQRAATLHRVFESLQSQTLCHDEFEWLIVDDGSTDGTDALVASWSAAADFPIRYIWQHNAGKHRAWNVAAREARGELFASIDSDDACVPGALERLWDCWSGAGRAAASAAGIIARCSLPDGSLLGPPLAPRTAHLNFAELVLCKRFTWDVWHVTRSEVIQRHPFPSGPSGECLPEGTLWHSVQADWLVLDEPLKIYFTGEEFGRSDQLSSRGSVLDNAPGLLLYHKSILTSSWRFFRRAPLQFARSGFHFVRFCFDTGDNFVNHVRDIPERSARTLCWLLLAPGFAASLWDRRSGEYR
jgi:glycosyltransferase involved in cell wall biosynthesis